MTSKAACISQCVMRTTGFSSVFTTTRFRNVEHEHCKSEEILYSRKTFLRYFDHENQMEDMDSEKGLKELHNKF